MTLDRNGYSLSLLQPDDLPRCYLCDRTDGKLDRHEIFGASCRQKSKRLGLWVLLCRKCHEEAHKERKTNLRLKRAGQATAEYVFEWNHDDFRREFGRNYLEEEQ